MKTYLKRLSAPAALIVAVLLLMPSQGSAQIPLPLPTNSPTKQPTPDPAPTPPPTQEPTPPPGGDDDGGGDDGGGDDDGGSGGGSGGGGSGGGKRDETTTPGRKPGRPGNPDNSGSAGGAPAGERPTPTAVEKGIAAWLAREKSPARTTTRLLELLAALKGDPAPLTVDDMADGFVRFPILGYVWYQDDYAAPRYIPYYHPHAGTDLFATTGTPVSAVANGRIWKVAGGPITGNAIWLRTGSRAYFFYGHLHSLAPGIKPGKRVRVGDIIGYVGATGNAVGTPPHVHFEIHPTGSPEHSVNPKPILDGWLAQAENRALGVLGFEPSGAGVAGAAPWASFLGSMGGGASSLNLWTASLSGSTLFGMLDMTLADVLARHDMNELPSLGADSIQFTNTYDPANPLGALLGTGPEAHNE